MKNRLKRLTGFRRVEEMDYLGIKLAMRKLCKADFEGLLQKAKGKLMAWGNRHLSMAGRATLINHALLPATMYSLTHSTLPVNVMNELEKLCQGFLWNSSPIQKNLHYVSWKQVCQPKETGGLGFHACAQWRGPLRTKFAWDFFKNPHSLLNRCLWERYGCDPWGREAKRADSVAWQIVCEGAKFLQPLSHWRIANGKHIAALSSNWCGDLPIAKLPTYCNIQQLEGKTVADFFLPNLQWNCPKIEDIFGPIGAENIIQTPYDPLLPRDQLVLNDGSKAKSLCALAYTNGFTAGTTQDKWLHRLHLHPRTKFFWWRILKQALPTNCWLARRSLSPTTECVWNCQNEETVDHITTTCLGLQSTLDQMEAWGCATPRFQHLHQLQHALQHLNKASYSWGRLYCTAVYQCWRARTAKHGQQFNTPRVLAHNTISSILHEPIYQSLEHWDPNWSSRRPSYPFWSPPPLQVGTRQMWMDLSNSRDKQQLE